MSFSVSQQRLVRRPRVLATSGLIAASLTLAAAGAAGAATVPNSPFKPIKGSNVDVAVAPDGTGYVVAVQDNSPGHEGLLGLCRIPRGARKCDLTQQFTTTPTAEFNSTKPYVFTPDDTTVDVVAYDLDSAGAGQARLRIWRSSNRGVSFDGGTTIGTVNPQGDLVLGPGNSVTGVNDSSTLGLQLQNAPFDGSLATASPAVVTGNSYASALTVLPDGSVLLASSSAETCPCSLTVQRAAAGANLNLPGSWSAVYSGGTTYARLATGPSGTYLMSYSTGNDTWYVQKWNGTTFGKPNKLTTSDDDNRMALRESTNGVLYALVQGKTVLSTGNRPLELFHSHDGVHWTEQTLAGTTGFDDSFAVAADGGGFAANDTEAFSGAVSVVAIPAPRAISSGVAKGAISGHVTPLGHSWSVALQVKHGKTWVTVRRTTTAKKSGKYSLTLPSVAAGKSIVVRAVATPVEGWAEADSRAYTIR